MLSHIIMRIPLIQLSNYIYALFNLHIHTVVLDIVHLMLDVGDNTFVDLCFYIYVGSLVRSRNVQRRNSQLATS